MRTSEDLLAVDEALASGRPDAADPAARELQEIALALRADAPEPDPAFVRSLDERVARRFERPRRARSLLPSRRLALAGSAALVTVIAAAGAVAGLSGGDGQQFEPLRQVAPRARGPVQDAIERKGPAAAGVPTA